jgi:large subunit ribosomal protein L22
MQAHLTSHNQPPRKVRLVTDLVKGKTVQQALSELSFLPKRAALPVYKLIASAAANATTKGAKIEDLRVENIQVDSAGMTVKYMPRAMGRAAPVRRRKSQISVFLKDSSEKAKASSNNSVAGS